MGALRAYEKADAVVEGFGSLLGRGLEALTDDVLRVWQSSAVWLVLAGALQTAVRIHTVHQTISFVVLAVCAQSLHGHVTACSPPAGLADTMPAILVQGTSPIAITQPWASLDGAVLSVPPLAAFTLAILASPVLCTAWVAGSLVAGRACPTLFTAAAATHAHTMGTAVHGTDFVGAVGARPIGITCAGATILEVGAVARTLVWAHGLEYFTVVSTPAWIAMTLSMDAHTMARTPGVQAVSFLAVLAFVPRVAGTGAHDADPAAPTLWVDALGGGHITLGALPATEAQAAALGVLSVSAAEHGTGSSGTIWTQKSWETVAGS